MSGSKEKVEGEGKGGTSGCMVDVGGWVGMVVTEV
jgi:hypothetical protein